MNGKSIRRQQIKIGMRKKYFDFYQELGRRDESHLAETAAANGENERKFRDRVMELWARDKQDQGRPVRPHRSGGGSPA